MNNNFAKEWLEFFCLILGFVLFWFQKQTLKKPHFSSFSRKSWQTQGNIKNRTYLINFLQIIFCQTATLILLLDSQFCFVLISKADFVDLQKPLFFFFSWKSWQTQGNIKIKPTWLVYLDGILSEGNLDFLFDSGFYFILISKAVFAEAALFPFSKVKLTDSR